MAAAGGASGANVDATYKKGTIEASRQVVWKPRRVQTSKGSRAASGAFILLDLSSETGLLRVVSSTSETSARRLLGLFRQFLSATCE